MDTPQTQLDFARPPVDEVVLSVLFEPLKELLAPHLGEIWQEFKPEFERIMEHPPVPPRVEKFPNPIGEVPQVHVERGPNLARIWFMHEDDSRLIQVQRDRFTFNWRKTGTTPRYPGFAAIFADFEGFYNRFSHVLEKQGIGEIRPMQYELTYVDQLFHGNGWTTLNDIGKIYNFFVPTQQLNSFWSDAESMIFRTSFSVPDLHGRLHLSISTRVKMPEQQQTLQTDFTMRGFPENAEYDAMIAWFKTARARMRDKFSSIFTEGVQTQVWGRK